MSTAARPTGGPEDPTDPSARPSPPGPSRSTVRVLLDWRDGSAEALAEECVLCGQATWCCSPRGVPCHKTCAEVWVGDRRPTVDDPTGDSAGDDPAAGSSGAERAGERS